MRQGVIVNITRALSQRGYSCILLIIWPPARRFARCEIPMRRNAHRITTHRPGQVRSVLVTTRPDTPARRPAPCGESFRLRMTMSTAARPRVGFLQPTTSPTTKETCNGLSQSYGQKNTCDLRCFETVRDSARSAGVFYFTFVFICVMPTSVRTTLSG